MAGNTEDNLKALQKATGLSIGLLRRVPTEAELSSLSLKKIGKGYKLLAATLGIDQVQVEHIVCDNPNNVADQILHILIKWRNKNASEATIAVLVKAMQDNEMGIDNLNTIFK